MVKTATQQPAGTCDCVSIKVWLIIFAVVSLLVFMLPVFTFLDIDAIADEKNLKRVVDIEPEELGWVVVSAELVFFTVILLVGILLSSQQILFTWMFITPVFDLLLFALAIWVIVETIGVEGGLQYSSQIFKVTVCIMLCCFLLFTGFMWYLTYRYRKKLIAFNNA